MRIGKRLGLVVGGLLLTVTCAQAAVTVRSKNQGGGSASTGDTTVTEPAGCASGDVEVALALADIGTSLTRPTGWTQIAAYVGSTTAMMWEVDYITRGGSAPSLTWTVTGTTKYREVYIVCLQGAAAITLDSQSATGASGTSGNTTPSHDPDPPATIAVATTSLAIAGGINYGGSLAGGYTVSTGYTVQTSNVAGLSGVIESKSLSAAGSENPSAITNDVNGVQDYWDGFTVTFTDAGGGGCTRSPTLTLMGVGNCKG